MKTFNYFVFALITISLNSCIWSNEDPGPLQPSEEEYVIKDFNRLEMGDALDITVEQGEVFSVRANGDRRNLDDLEVFKDGSVLRVQFANFRTNRRHTTYITVTMPSIQGATFSGATNSRIKGFTTEGTLLLVLTGASVMDISGVSPVLDLTVSGASDFRGFDLATEVATVEASGASMIRVSVAKQLDADASGASDIRYRGTPMVNTKVSGASSIAKD